METGDFERQPSTGRLSIRHRQPEEQTGQVQGLTVIKASTAGPETKTGWAARTISSLLLLALACSDAAVQHRLPPGATEADRLREFSPDRAFTFVVYGDSRPNAQHARLLRAIERVRPDFVLHTGDLVSDGSSQRQWQRFESQADPFRTRFPFFPALGNHDRGPFFVHEFQLPYADSTGLFYSFTVGETKFICLNSEIARDSALWTKQLDWLGQQVTDPQPRHIFVFFHRPPFSPNPRRAPVNREVATDILPILRAAPRVRAVFCGHDHFYYRTRREGLTIVTTGGGGAGLYPVDPNRLLPEDRWATAFHFVVVHVNRDTIRATTYRRDGKVLDRFDLFPEAGTPVSGVRASRTPPNLHCWSRS